MAIPSRSSFRDPEATLQLDSAHAIRIPRKAQFSELPKFRSSKLYQSLVEQEKLLAFELASGEEYGISSDQIAISKKISPLSYPYEWSFEMLRDAALLTLDISEQSLKEGYTLKDASSFNIVFDGTQPKFVDHSSFETAENLFSWVAYSQFCRSFLFPLLIEAHKTIPSRELLKAFFGEIPVETASCFFSLGDLFKKGVFRDLYLQNWLHASGAGAPRNLKTQARQFQIPTELILKNIQRLQKLILKLPNTRTSLWQSYEEQKNYGRDQEQQKEVFVEECFSKLAVDQAIDLGSNTGRFSRVLAKHAKKVISLDTDSRCIDYGNQQCKGSKQHFLLVADLANTSPAMGWAMQERASLFERLQANAFCALALLHHLRITHGVPLNMIFETLKNFGEHGVIEWIGREDPQLQELLALREDVFEDYHESSFQTLLAQHFEILKQEPIQGMDRHLYFVKTRRL